MQHYALVTWGDGTPHKVLVAETMISVYSLANVWVEGTLPPGTRSRLRYLGTTTPVEFEGVDLQNALSRGLRGAAYWSCEACGDDYELHEWVLVSPESTQVIACDRERV